MAQGIGVLEVCCCALVQLGGGGDWYPNKDLYAGCTWRCLTASEVVSTYLYVSYLGLRVVGVESSTVR